MSSRSGQGPQQAGGPQPSPHSLSHVVPLLDGTAQRSKTSRCVLTSGPLHRLRSHCAVAVLSPEPSAYDPPPKEALPHFVLPGLGPSTKPLLFFLEPASGFPETQTKRSACGTPQKHGTLLVPLSGIQALQLPPPLAGAASPPHSRPQPPELSLPAPRVTGDRTPVLRFGVYLLALRQAALLPFWRVINPLKSITATPFRELSPAARGAF